jgi:hypothetical protein
MMPAVTRIGNHSAWYRPTGIDVLDQGPDVRPRDRFLAGPGAEKQVRRSQVGNTILCPAAEPIEQHWSPSHEGVTVPVRVTINDNMHYVLSGLWPRVPDRVA